LPIPDVEVIDPHVGGVLHRDAIHPIHVDGARALNPHVAQDDVAGVLDVEATDQRGAWQAEDRLVGGDRDPSGDAITHRAGNDDDLGAAGRGLRLEIGETIDRDRRSATASGRTAVLGAPPHGGAKVGGLERQDAAPKGE
jgi:hypothetical protein